MIHETPDHRDVARDPSCVLAPKTVRTLRVLGHGRATVARLVEAQWPDGRRVTCVEKVFAPGLLTWLDRSMPAFQFRIGSAAPEQLRADVSRWIEHTARWKESEFALLRRPWRHFNRQRATAYQQQVFQRWQIAGTVDNQSAAELGRCRIESAIRKWQDRDQWLVSVVGG